MIKKSSAIIFYLLFLFLFLFFIKIGPIFTDSNPTLSFKIYIAHLTDEKIDVAEFFKGSDMVCAIGPYDSFHGRFHSQLSEKQIETANKALDKRNKESFGSNNFFLVGFNADNLNNVYYSNYFTNMTSVEKNHADCVTSKGKITTKNYNGVIAILLIKGE